MSLAAIAGGATHAQMAGFTQLGVIAGAADYVEVAGARAFVAGGKTVTIVDVADPGAPKPLGSYTFPELIWGMAVSGTTLYVAADTYGLGILDVSQPDAPVLLGAIRTPGQAKNVALAGSQALVADHVSGIDVIDVSSPGSPRLVTSMFVDGFAKDVVARGTLLYTLDQPNGLNVFDVSSRAEAPLGTATLPIPIALRSQMDVNEGAAPRLAAIAGGGPMVQLFDVTDARAPKHVTNYRTPGNAVRVALRGAMLYVADGIAGLSVVSLANPSTPAVASTHKTPMPARDVAVAGDLVFVVSGSDSVLILREPRDWLPR